MSKRMPMLTLLKAIGSTEPSDFNEICRALGDDCPRPSDSEYTWRDFFAALNTAQDQGLIEVDWAGNRINTVILTEAGVAKVKEGQ